MFEQRFIIYSINLAENEKLRKVIYEIKRVRVNVTHNKFEVKNNAVWH